MHQLDFVLGNELLCEYGTVESRDWNIGDERRNKNKNEKTSVIRKKIC